ncbi:hypothetical protein GCM10022225_68010 [Plantactinospora mayteni]|uniref:Uncharacterized protein n=1 Tax=Plantactinospora mayteni TaxID=566021 RepID=A0ABQ4EVD2_9ACTN|nr:hypothetical protein [Plantactinospora mayteni]GIG98601.1 hypothetical protein Pma05_51740 [Plantactinospora mayteni]
MARVRRTEASIDQLSAREYAQLAGLVEEFGRRLTGMLAEHPSFAAPETGPKPGDVDDERARRAAYLRRVRAGQAAQALLAEVAAGCAAEDAADAVWLGASLADLGESTGSSRQAARKRWPELGRIYRIRRWVSGHADDLVTVLRMVLDQAPDYTAPDGSAETLDRAVRALDAALAEALRRRDSGSVLDPETGRPARWRRLADAVDQHLRVVVELAGAATPEADTALAAARGVLAHHDAVVLAAEG